MATATTRKPRTSVEAVPQLATLPERVAVVETKIYQIEDKIDNLKSDVKEMHDCLDRTREGIMEELKCMQDSYWQNANKYYTHAEDLNAIQTQQHNELSEKIKELQTIKEKWVRYSLVGLAFAAGAGWVHADYAAILKFLGV